MSSTNEDTPKKLKSKKDPSRFLSPGLFFRGKFIGIEHVADARGDRSDMMCQVAMAKMKAAIKTLGDHKKKIVINISVNGIRIIEERNEEVMFDHGLARISYISRDISDSRAFGYVFNPDEDCHEFFGIKTEKAAEVIVSSLKDLFCFVCTSEVSRGTLQLPDDNPQEEESTMKMPSPGYNLKYGWSVGEGSTLGRLKKSPHLLYRFYNTMSSAPVTGLSSPRKQAGFLTLYNCQSSAALQQSPINSSPVNSSHRVHPSPNAATKTPSLSSSSSSNQNVNSPSASALKSPLPIIASKESLSSLSPPPAIDSPLSISATFNKLASSSSMSLRTTADLPPPAEKISTSKTLGEFKAIPLKDVQPEKQFCSVQAFPESEVAEARTINGHKFSEGSEDNQMSWANFDEFDLSDESPRGCQNEVDAAGSDFALETESRLLLAGAERPNEVDRFPEFRSSSLILSFNGIDPFVDDPFFNKSLDSTFGKFETGGSILADFVGSSPRPAGCDTWIDCDDVQGGDLEVNSAAINDLSFPRLESRSGSSPPPRPSESFGNRRSEGKFFEDDFAPEVAVEEDDGSLRSRNLNDQRRERLERQTSVEDDSPALTRDHFPSSFPPRSIDLLLKTNSLDDNSPTSQTSRPSEFPSPDIPPPPLPPEVVSRSPLPLPPPPLPPRRSIVRNVSEDAKRDATVCSTLGRSKQNEPDTAQKLDTASILKLYSVPAASYFSSAAVSTKHHPLHPSFQEEPALGNYHSVFVDSNLNVSTGPGTFLHGLPTAPPSIPSRRPSPSPFTFHSQSLVNAPSYNQDNIEDSNCFSKSLDMSGI